MMTIGPPGTTLKVVLKSLPTLKFLTDGLLKLITQQSNLHLSWF